MPPEPPHAYRPAGLLAPVIAAAKAAGDLVAAEFARPDGPRFSDHVTAPLDTEIEMILRDRLLALVPARFVGEEAGVLAAPTEGADGYCWVVDPHDGTRAFLEGRRGSAVSIALLRHGTPVLAVVYAPTSPDRGPDLIDWALGEPTRRNGQVVTIDLRERELAAGDVVLLNHGAWQRPVWHGAACAPAGFMPLPSIAYRLARIAVGDGIATLTLRPVNALDIAAGHALLMAAGGVLVAEDGEPVTYNELGESRPSACFGGAPKAVATLRSRTWRGSTEPRREPRVTLTWPRSAPEAMLDRAAGCLFGVAVGGDLGPDTELAVVIARVLVGGTEYDRAAVEAAIQTWKNDGGATDAASPLARAVPIGIWARDPETAADIARLDCPDAADNPTLAAVIARAIGGAGEPRAAPGVSRGSVAAAIGGAVRGRGAFPVHQVMRVLTRRPDAGSGAAHPRPEYCWTDDLVDLAEALLCQGQRNFRSRESG